MKTKRCVDLIGRINVKCSINDTIQFVFAKDCLMGVKLSACVIVDNFDRFPYGSVFFVYFLMVYNQRC